MNPSEPSPGNPMQQLVERLRTGVNVLVTVSNNPSVDQLSAAIGFTIVLNHMGKHATAVFSGEVPSTIEFLKPEQTIEKTTDSLRDFIVSLDKSKADKLRYKVEENVVKIFITPYHSSITEKDLQFSQGDFNVDIVLALGVKEREQLDQAIVSHGRILHDATVVTVSAGRQTSTLGAINWQDTGASSLCEMLVSIADQLQPGALDNQTATAFLTGIVAETDRFRNSKTTPKLMTMAAQLMTAGANQQLIATQLEKPVEEKVEVLEKDSKEPVPLVEPTEAGALNIPHQDDKQPTEEDTSEDAAGSSQDILPVVSEETEIEAETETESQDKNVDDDAETDDISIDEHGNILPSANQEKGSSKKGPRRLEPLEGQQPPKPKHPLDQDYFTGSTDSEKGGNESADPMSQVPVNDSLLSHTAPALSDSSTLRDIEYTVASPHIATDPTSTLSDDIETVAVSPHLDQAVPTGEPSTGSGLDVARDAVEDAIEAAPYDVNRPEPLQALNAAPVDLTMVNTPPPPDFSLSSAPTTTIPPAPDPFMPQAAPGGPLTPLDPYSNPPQTSVLPPLDPQLQPYAGAPVPDDSSQVTQDDTRDSSSGPPPPPVPPPMVPVQ